MQLSRFDDEAFAALANRGLLRRAKKDLEKQHVNIIDESPDALTLGFDSFSIRFDIHGPAQAQCSCPAAGVCQHILAAAIGLQQLTASEASNASAAPVEDTLEQLHTALMQVASSELSRYAGKSGYRWAWQFVHDLDGEEAVKISGERHLVIQFVHPRMSFRYMGGGLDSLIADVDISQIEKYRVAAVLAYQRSHGGNLVAPEPVGKDRSAALDLGKDHVGAELIGEALRDSRTRLRESVKQLIEECIALGLSHLSRGICDRYATLAVWAQGAEYYRLALMLRRLADHVKLLLERAGAADEHRLLDELALAFGLVNALEAAQTKGMSPSYLVGQARSRYEGGGTLELLGLGAHTWRSASGYVGLTMMFWSPQDQAFLSCTDARPEQQRNFNPMARYKAVGPWGGLGAPAQATGRCVTLTGAQLNAAGRLSAAESTSASMKSSKLGASFSEQLKPSKNWAELMQARSQARRSLLGEPQPMKDWAVLQPTRYGAPQFDEARQTLVWPLFDENDQSLSVELVYSEQTAHAIARVEQIERGQLPAGTMLVARMRGSVNGLVAEPLSLIRPHAGADENPVDSLYFDAAPEPDRATKWLDKLRRLTSRTEMAAPDLAKPALIMPRALREFRHWVQRQAERGVVDGAAQRALDQLLTLQESSSAAGLTALRQVSLPNDSVTTQLLRAHYICLQYERLIEDV
ncbi:hypothetical protein [Collimonas humicola]|uniref:hypothetical protein n=1 Tax=Collimonas humicola TaxID=2825886 RepID=UPI001B8ABC93|nr:hypothetical protein [Collimonas humicola]